MAPGTSVLEAMRHSLIPTIAVLGMVGSTTTT
jgi:hypothetical protein